MEMSAMMISKMIRCGNSETTMAHETISSGGQLVDTGNQTVTTSAKYKIVNAFDANQGLGFVNGVQENTIGEVEADKAISWNLIQAEPNKTEKEVVEELDVIQISSEGMRLALDPSKPLPIAIPSQDPLPQNSVDRFSIRCSTTADGAYNIGYAGGNTTEGNTTDDIKTALQIKLVRSEQ